MLFQLSGSLFSTLLLWSSIFPTILAADELFRSNLPTKSDYRCGESEFKARTNCGKLCVYNTDCANGEYCWGTSPNKCYVNEMSTSSTSTATTPPPSMKPIDSTLPIGFTSSTANLGPPNPNFPPRTDYRCGVDEEDSRSNCGKVCIYNSDCESDEYCWSTFPNLCYINDSQVVPVPPSTSSPVEIISTPANDPNPTEPPIEATTAPNDLTPTQAPTTRAPTSGAPVKIPTSSQLSSPPVFSSAPSSKPLPRSDFRCGTDEEDSRTNCGKVCIFISDCDPGEYCWSTFPNTCYIDDFLNDLLIGGVPVDTGSPISSIPITDDTPVTNNPTTLTPTTSAPTTSAPVTSSPTTSAPVTLAPTSSAPTTSEPTSSAPLMATFAPVTFAPATFAPIVNANPAISPDTPSTSCPEIPANGCSICGENKCVGKLDAIFEFPGQPAVPCSILEKAGYDGLIPAKECPMLPPLIGACGCMDSTPIELTSEEEEIESSEEVGDDDDSDESSDKDSSDENTDSESSSDEDKEEEATANPTLAPVNPTSAPISTITTSAPVNPTSAPVVSTSAPISSAPVEPTLAPVNPTLAPVDPTSAPITPTLAPVAPTSAPVATSGMINFDPTFAPVVPVTNPQNPSPPFIISTEFVPRSDFRCGVDEEDSRINCGRLCTFNSDCKNGEYCWSTFPNTCYANNLQPIIPGNDTEDAEPISDYRCGSSEADARGNCKNECATQEDCQIGEYCWPTLPNYCHRTAN